LPEIARSVGRALNELKRQAADIRGEFEAGLDLNDDEPAIKEPAIKEPVTKDEVAAPDEPAKAKPEDPGTEEH
jgi:Sec-independent protein translocase protein TatA